MALCLLLTMVFRRISSKSTKKQSRRSARPNARNNIRAVSEILLQRFFLDLVLPRSLKEKQAFALLNYSQSDGQGTPCDSGTVAPL
jgi:hypothetical protein